MSVFLAALKGRTQERARMTVLSLELKRPNAQPISFEMEIDETRGDKCDIDIRSRQDMHEFAGVDGYMKAIPAGRPRSSVTLRAESDMARVTVK